MEEEKETKVIPFAVLPGGKEPPKKGDNWLGKLTLWTYFNCFSPSKSPIDAFLYQIIGKENNSTWLRLIQDGKSTTHWAPNESFSDYWTLLDILEIGEDIGAGDNHSDRRVEVIENTEQDDSMA